MSVAHDRPVSSIRLAARGEIPELQSLIAAALAQYEGKASAAVFKPYVENSCNIGERWDEGQVPALDCEGHIAGTVTYYADAAREDLGLPQGWAGFRTLAVHPSARNFGFGRLLTDWCLRGHPDVARHIDVVARQLGIARGMVMEQATVRHTALL